MPENLHPRAIPVAAVFAAVAEGWGNLRCCLLPAMAYAAVFALIGLLIFALLLHFSVAAMILPFAGGFRLVGPAVLAGFCGLRRALVAGRRPSAQDVFQAFRQAPRGLVVVQRAIARALGRIDERIELCEQMDAGLDRLVRLVFRAWFRGVAPTHAPREGTLHASTDDAEAALFPTEFSNHHELGRIPRGWTPTAVAGLATFHNGIAFVADDLCARTRPGAKPIIKTGEIKRGITDQTQFAHAPRRARPIADGDLLMSWSGNPQTSIGTSMWYGGPAWLNQHIVQVQPAAPHWRAFMFSS